MKNESANLLKESADLKKKAAELLRQAGVPEADLDIESRELTAFADGDIEKLKAAAKRRANGEPLQYILGEWDFYNLTFKVGDGVLIPRPETELIVDLSLDYLSENFDAEPEDEMDNIYRIVYGKDACRSEKKTPLVLDLCAGTGCIGTTIAKNFPNSKVFEVEKSHKAFEYLKQNIALNKVNNVTPFLDDVIEGCKHLAESSKFYFDLIVSNPPYVKSDEISGLQKEVGFEPRMALDGGEDGLMFYRCISDKWLPRLKSGGLMLLECGEDQADLIVDLMRNSLSTSCIEVSKIKDFAGIYRVVSIKRS